MRALEAGKSYEVPGFENLIATWIARALPRGTVTRAMKRVMRRYWEKPG
jgi:hypothetical protein